MEVRSSNFLHENWKASSGGTVYIVASDFNPAIKRGKDHMSSIGTTHIENNIEIMTMMNYVPSLRLWMFLLAFAKRNKFRSYNMIQAYGFIKNGMWTSAVP